MSFNPSGAVEIPLSTFGGLITEVNPSDVPFGLSPDNADVAFSPGSVATRDGLQRAIPAFPAGGPNNKIPAVNYAKSYKAPDGTITNLFLDSNGGLWSKKLVGTETKLLDSTPLSWAKSVTAFGREYIAISDGNLGQEMPLQFDGTNLDRFTQDGPGAPPIVANLELAPTVISGIARAANTVSVSTTTPHGLLDGYQAQIGGTPATLVGGPIVLITIKNEDSPGIATVVMTSAHGLAPGVFVSIEGVAATVVGTGNASISRAGQIVTVETTTAHGLTPGAVITLNAPTDVSFAATFVVQQVTSPTTYVLYQVGPDVVSGGGNTQLNWPIPATATPTYFEVVAAPNSITFQVALDYSDGAWSGGTVSHSWDGTFHVFGVSASAFQYQQYGPDAGGSAGGSVTPYGQASPGKHQCQVSFLTRTGAVTAPSPPVPFVANGGQYLEISNIPIGPANVVGRILLFTGTDGADFFYIPFPAQVNGQRVSTATQINDNTSTSVVLDFSDNTLFGATAASIPGNNLANQIPLDGALGFGLSGSRLITCGQRNRITNLLNMGFDGGALPSAPTKPTGWVSPDGDGALVPGRLGEAWQITIPAGNATHGILAQSLYADAYGAPIAQPNTSYRIRCWIKVSAAIAGLRFEAQMQSISTGFNSFAIFDFALTTQGSWLEVTFTAPTPSVIPADLSLQLFAVSLNAPAVLTVDEVSMIYVDRPALDATLYGSYVNNPEGIDGVSGKFGPSSDVHKVMTMGIIRDSLYLLTQDPGGRIHSVADNGITEPAGWRISEVAAQCGALSAFCLTQSQLDDSTAAGGEEWFAWASTSGPRLFNGSDPWKMGQEIQPTWDAMNTNGALFVWALNDPNKREMYFGIPTTAAAPGSPPAYPSAIFVLNYTLLDGAWMMAQGSPLSNPTSDQVRKWTVWQRPMNSAAILYLQSGFLVETAAVFCCGFPNGSTQDAFGTVYTLAPGGFSDQDFGQINSYYTTHFFVPPELEGQLRLGSHMKMLSYFTAIVSGVGTLSITPLINKLTRAWSLTCQRVLSADPDYDLEWTGGSASGQRIAFRVSVAPITGTDNYFSLSRMAPAMKANVHLPVRGSAA